MKERIWELDAFRGICILGMIVVHFVYDVTVLYRLAKWQIPEAFYFVQRWGGVLFLLISGICVTLGSRSIRRGLIVFGCGMVITAVTYGMYALDFSDKSILIYFGVLHCLGICMILWPLFRKLPTWALAILGAVMVAFGLYLQGISPASTPWLLPLGFTYPGFVSSDYFPLLPNLGYFLLGAVLGRTLYRQKKSLLPRVNPGNSPVRFFTACGRLSLPIYMLHQPVITGLIFLYTLLT